MRIDQPIKAPAVEYVHTTNVPELLSRLRISLLVSTYQAQRIMCLSPGQQRLSMLMRVLPRPTGMALYKNTLAVCSNHQVWLFRAAFDVRNPDGSNDEPKDIWFVPRQSYVTGDILAHEIAFIDEEPLVINTRFSCLSKLSSDWSFTPVWKPKFVSQIAPEDRCHLNGMASENGRLKYISALAETDTPRGWHEKRIGGGILIDFDQNEILSRGLCMPHSPRIFNDQLWVLDSGRGMLKQVNRSNGESTDVREFPGYLRGLAFYGDYAFVGLCKIREKKTFGGLPVEEKHQNLACAIHIVNLKTGSVEGFIEFTKGIEEIFDITVLPNVQQPEIVGFEEEMIKGLFIVDPEARGTSGR